MKAAHAIESGLTGITTVTLLQEALHKIDGRAPRPLFSNARFMKKLKKSKGENPKTNKYYIRLAGELLANAAYFGITGLGKKRNAVLRGGILGAAAGLGNAFLAQADEDADVGISQNRPTSKEKLRKNILTVSLYTAGGLLAGVMVKKIAKHKKRKSK